MVCPDDPSPVSSPGGIKASYGLNAHAWHMDAQDNGRIVFLDYKQLEARIVGQDSAPPVSRSARPAAGTG